MYLYESHLHTKETSPCGWVPAEEQVQKYRALGFSGIVVTDHLHDDYFKTLGDVTDWQELMDDYLSGYKAAVKAAEGLDFDVILGAEIRFPENDNDYLLYGIDEEFLRSHPFLNRSDQKTFFERYKDELLMLHAHPYRNGNRTVKLEYTHGLEIINGNPRHENANELAFESAKKLPNLIRVCGSDAHRPGDEGYSAMAFTKRLHDSYEYKEAVESGMFELVCGAHKDVVEQNEAFAAELKLKKHYKTAIIGQVCLDVNTDYGGEPYHAFGGAVLFSGYAAANTGNDIAVVPKVCRDTINLTEAFADAPRAAVFPVYCAESTSIENVYLTPDRERRNQRILSTIPSYELSDIPEINADIYHLAGLVRGDIPQELIEGLSSRARLALDVQCMLRCAEDGKLVFHDWDDKKKYLPMIDFLKTDALEAEILTGLTDRREAAKLLYSWGAKEIMITHNTEVLVYDGKSFYTQPLKPRDLSGRTGRGDTTFSVYLCERTSEDIATSLLRAAALVSLKMETVGPYKGTRQDMFEYISRFYAKEETI